MAMPVAVLMPEPDNKPSRREVAHLLLSIKVNRMRMKLVEATELCASAEDMAEVVGRMLDDLQGELEHVLG